MQRVLLAALLFLVGVSGCAKAPVTLDVSGLKEASTNFDQENVGPFLARLPPLFKSGFGTKEATELTKLIADLPLESTGMWEYSVSINGKTERLVVSAFQDDINAPDISFYASQPTTDAIAREMASFSNELGE